MPTGQLARRLPYTVLLNLLAERAASLSDMQVIGIDAFSNGLRVERAIQDCTCFKVGLEHTVNPLDIVFGWETEGGWLNNQILHSVGQIVMLRLHLAGQVANSAGGYSYPVDDWARLRRFLVLGSEGGSYYAAERTLTRENAEAVARCLAADGPRAVVEIVAVSAAGRAPKNAPALFALALAATADSIETRRAALRALSQAVETFVVSTDSETWFGNVHPAEALRRYRERMGIPAKLLAKLARSAIVVGMLANRFSIADPADGGMLDVVGFDTAAPQVMRDFSFD